MSAPPRDRLKEELASAEAPLGYEEPKDNPILVRVESEVREFGELT